MLYPCILLVLALIVLVVLLTFFIPKFQRVFASIHGALPLITQIIIAASHHRAFLRNIRGVGAGGHRTSAAHLVCFRKRQAHVGRHRF